MGCVSSANGHIWVMYDQGDKEGQAAAETAVKNWTEMYNKMGVHFHA